MKYQCPVCGKIVEGPIESSKKLYRCNRCKKAIMNDYKEVKNNG